METSFLNSPIGSSCGVEPHARLNAKGLTGDEEPMRSLNLGEGCKIVVIVTETEDRPFHI
jgi:hypothetical protein